LPGFALLPGFVAHLLTNLLQPRLGARFWRMMVVWNEATQGRPKPGMH
jgi:hypothetical protein